MLKKGKKTNNQKTTKTPVFLLHESTVKILCRLCPGASSKDNFTKKETASTEVATSSSVPVSPEEKFCLCKQIQFITEEIVL